MFTAKKRDLLYISWNRRWDYNVSLSLFQYPVYPVSQNFPAILILTRMSSDITICHFLYIHVILYNYVSCNIICYSLNIYCLCYTKIQVCWICTNFASFLADHDGDATHFEIDYFTTASWSCKDCGFILDISIFLSDCHSGWIWKKLSKYHKRYSGICVSVSRQQCKFLKSAL